MRKEGCMAIRIQAGTEHRITRLVLSSTMWGNVVSRSTTMNEVSIMAIDKRSNSMQQLTELISNQFGHIGRVTNGWHHPNVMSASCPKFVDERRKTQPSSQHGCVKSSKITFASNFLSESYMLGCRGRSCGVCFAEECGGGTCE